MPGIIWVASYPKSGNTWVRMFLESALANIQEPMNVNGKKQFVTGESAYGWFRTCHGSDFDVNDTNTIQGLRPSVHEKLKSLSDQNVLIKTHNALIEVADVPLISMEHTAGAIYIIRNPLDIADSLADHMGLTLDGAIEFMCSHTSVGIGADKKLVREYYGSWSDHVYSWTAQTSPHILILRYEDMLSEPVREFGRLMRFLKHPLSDERLKEVVDLTSFDRLKNSEDTHGFTERSEKSKAGRFFREGKAGRWRKVLTKKQIKKIKSKHEVVMKRYGYL